MGLAQGLRRQTTMDLKRIRSGTGHGQLEILPQPAEQSCDIFNPAGVRPVNHNDTNKQPGIVENRPCSRPRILRSLFGDNARSNPEPVIRWSPMKTTATASIATVALFCAFMQTKAGASETIAGGPADVRQAPEEYPQKREAVVAIEIPEIFELANVAIAISDEGLKHPNRVHKLGPYYDRVLMHFLPFKAHPLILESDLHRNYTYFFRDNSVCYRFDGDKIVHGGVYPPMRTPDLFGKHRALAEDFAATTGFREFYRRNLSYYSNQIQRYDQKVPLRRMSTWLEALSPIRSHRYRIIFSPLLGSSHETCGFETNGVRETLMFVCGPGERGEGDDAIGDALLAKTVFTEIDHNYVNPITARFATQVKQAFADLGKWSSPENADSYPRSEFVFNEYMTWAVFLLWARDTYSPDTFEAVKKRVVGQMVNGRKFGRFGEFSDELLRLRRPGPAPQALVDFYPTILAWAERQ